jgi:hypothetical protein
VKVKRIRRVNPGLTDKEGLKMHGWQLWQFRNSKLKTNFQEAIIDLHRMVKLILQEL